MKNTPTWEAVSSSASQAVGPVLLNPKVHYLIHNSVQFFPILNQFTSVHVIPACFLKPISPVSANIRPDHKRGIFPFGWTSRPLLLSPTCATFRAHLNTIYYPHTVGEQYTVSSVQCCRSLCDILLPPATYIALRVFAQTARVRGGRDVFSMQSSLTVSGDDGRDQLLSHPSGLTLKR